MDVSVLQSSAAQSQGYFSLCCPASEELGVHKNVKEDRTRTAIVNCSKGCPILYNIMWKL